MIDYPDPYRRFKTPDPPVTPEELDQFILTWWNELATRKQPPMALLLLPYDLIPSLPKRTRLQLTEAILQFIRSRDS